MSLNNFSRDIKKYKFYFEFFIVICLHNINTYNLIMLMYL